MALQLLTMIVVFTGPAGADLTAQIAQLPEPTHASAATLQAFREARALLLDPGNQPGQQFRKAKAAGILGEIYLCFKLHRFADTCFQYAQAIIPREPRWHYFRSLIAVNDVRLEQAALLLTQSYQLALADPGVDDVQLVAILNELGNVYLDLGEVENAERQFELAMTWIPEAPAALWGLGRAASDRGNHEQAIAHFQRLLLLLPQAKSIHVQIGDAYRKLGDMEKANEHYALVPPRQPSWVFGTNPFRERLFYWDEAQRRYYQGEIALSRHEFLRAAERFRQALEIEPRPRFRRGLAIALMHQNRLDEAKKQIDTVLNQLPSDPISLNLLGRIAVQKEDFRTALKFYERVLSIDPQRQNAMFNCGICLWRLGDVDGAIKRFSQVLKTDPHAVDARIALIKIYREHDDDARALEWIEAAPQNSSGQFDQALAILLCSSRDDKVRDGQRALQLAKKLAEQDGSIENREILAAAYAACGQFDDAVSIQREVLAQAKDLPADVVERHQDNLQRYLAQQPCQKLW